MNAMTPVTFAVALLGIALVSVLRPGRAMAVVVGAMLLYADYLRIPMGLAQMSASRLVALALLARMLFRPERGEFRWCWADGIVVAIYFWNLFANVMSDAGQERMVFLVGNGLDTALIYFCARLALGRLEHRRDMVVPVCWMLIWLGFWGFVESFTSYTIYEKFRQYHAWRWMDKGLQYRELLGIRLLRAEGSASHSIYFGVSMFCLMALLISFASLRRYSRLTLVAIGFGLAGIVSSLSSGPQLSTTVFFGIGLLYFRPHWIKAGLIGVVVLGVLAEIASNRHFYHLVDYINIAGGGSFYRNRLLEVAVRFLPEYWLFGYGGPENHPHHWGPEIDGRRHVDVVNHYVLLAIYSGVTAPILYLIAQALVLRQAVVTWRVAGLRVRRMAFLQAAALIGVALGCLAVSLFAPAIGLIYLLMGTMAQQPLDEAEAFEEYDGEADDLAFDEAADEWDEPNASPARRGAFS